MRKYISLILLVIILFVSNGYHLYFKYLQHNIQQEIKHKIRNKLSKKELTLIVVSSNNKKKIKWTKENKEFIYNGLMYDIVKVETQGKEKYYYCINDTKEKDLIANYKKHNRHRNNTLLKIRKILSNKYFPEKLSINTKINKDDMCFIKYQQNYKSIYVETLSPPPKFYTFQ